MPNRVAHFEIPYDDGERAQAFYRDVFGWEAATVPGMDYTMVTTGPTDPGKGPTEAGFINGGMLARDETFTGPNIVVETDDIDATLAQAKQSGGSIVSGRQAVGDMGFTAYVRDTEGNLVGLWQNA